MGLIRAIQTAFSGGELSPRMMGRVDTAIYANGLETCENFVPTVEGPLVKRPGFEYIRPAAPTAGWLSTFRFSLTQDYVIEWSDTKARFFTNGGRIESGPTTPYEVTVPYSAAEARTVAHQQSYDRLYLDHRSYPPAALTRTSSSTFAYAALALKNGPFADANSDEAVTVTASGTAVGASITVTASAAIFFAGHVGALFRIEAKDFSSIKAWEASKKDILAGTILRNESKAYSTSAAGKTGTVPPTHTSGTEYDGTGTLDDNAKGPFGLPWTYKHDRFGIVQITGFTSGTVVTATVLRTLPDSLTSVASHRWAHGAFSGVAGYPNIVKTFEGRLLHIKDFDICASVAGDYLNHATFNALGTITGDLAFRRTIATEDPALWAAGDRKLIVGTASRELAIGAINSASALSGDNISAVAQSFYGVAMVWPVQVGTDTVFVARAGKKLRAARYDFGQDRYVATNLTAFARHVSGGLTTSGFIQVAFQKEPEELLFAVRADGQAAVKPMQAEQDPNNLLGFGRVIVGDGTLAGGGRILSAVSISSFDGQRDEIWALIQSDFGKWIGRMAEWREDADPLVNAFYVDAGTRGLAAIGQTSFSGFTHLANKPIAVLADGGVVDGVVVTAGGVVNIPASAVPSDRAYAIAFGLPYTARAVLLRPEARDARGTMQGKKQRVVRAVLRLLSTLGLRAGPKGGILDNLIDRPQSAFMDAAQPLFTMNTDKPVSGNFGTDGQLEFVSSDPLPATIIATMPDIDVE